MTKEEFEKIIKEEGDEVDFEAFGMPCYMLRVDKSGHWCGYVQVPKDSILFGKDANYCEENSEITLSDVAKSINDIRVHGGLTYSGDRKKDGNWCFGFDCGHFGDLTHYMFEYDLDETAVYRDKNYVINECKELAKQLKKIINEHNIR